MSYSCIGQLQSVSDHPINFSSLSNKWIRGYFQMTSSLTTGPYSLNFSSFASWYLSYLYFPINFMYIHWAPIIGKESGPGILRKICTKFLELSLRSRDVYLNRWRIEVRVEFVKHVRQVFWYFLDGLYQCCDGDGREKGESGCKARHCWCFLEIVMFQYQL